MPLFLSFHCKLQIIHLEKVSEIEWYESEEDLKKKIESDLILVRKVLE
ncbi:MAG: hypothetical protein ABII02_00920 [Candidatus Magasanikbacteria bacterium]